MTEFKPGDKVHHPLFGAGTIRAISGSGPDAKITIDFSASVGQKKLLASVANLRSAGADTPLAPAAAWFEILDAQLDPRSGRRPLRDKIVDGILHALRQTEFWIAVRERVRTRGSAPRVLDDISGKLACSLTGLLHMKLTIKHAELIRPTEAVLSQSIFDELASRFLADFALPRVSPKIETNIEWDEDQAIVIDDAPPENLPDRDPRRRPVRVTPKGVIKSRPKRRDDY
ncbi:MAG TPA: hypothetical protein VEK08_13285 [Planctomycetota bacterium]|nr:hypothetical protein [Planctomycetota bacterium]